MRFAAIVSVLGATGCLRVVDLDDGEEDVDGFVVSFDADTTDGGPDGLGGDCFAELPCPAPASGRATVCGRIYDTELDEVVVAPFTIVQPCDPGNPATSGPCALRVRYFDALDFAMNPTSAVALQPASSYVDDCGRFRALDLPRATFGFIGVAVDDAPGITPATPHFPTGVTVSNSLAVPARIRAYSTRASTDQAWSSSAGLTGASFAARGVLLKVFTYHGAPQAGVTARRNASGIPADDYYFSDTGLTRTTIAPGQAATGTNGSVLIVNSNTPIAHDGTGSEPGGCQWPSNLGASTPGVVSVQLTEAETPAGAPCP